MLGLNKRSICLVSCKVYTKIVKINGKPFQNNFLNVMLTKIKSTGNPNSVGNILIVSWIQVLRKEFGQNSKTIC